MTKADDDWFRTEWAKAGATEKEVRAADRERAIACLNAVDEEVSGFDKIARIARLIAETREDERRRRPDAKSDAWRDELRIALIKLSCLHNAAISNESLNEAGEAGMDHHHAELRKLLNRLLRPEAAPAPPERTDALKPSTVRALGMCGEPDPEDGAGCTHAVGHISPHWHEDVKPRIQAARQRRERATVEPACFLKDCVKPMPHTDHRDEDGMALPRPGSPARGSSADRVAGIIEEQILDLQADLRDDAPGNTKAAFQAAINQLVILRSLLAHEGLATPFTSATLVKP